MAPASLPERIQALIAEWRKLSADDGAASARQRSFDKGYYLGLSDARKVDAEVLEKALLAESAVFPQNEVRYATQEATVVQEAVAAGFADLTAGSTAVEKGNSTVAGRGGAVHADHSGRLENHRAVEVVSQASGWQPIETAPKDREILVYDEGATLIVVWVNDDGGGWWDNGIMNPPPTHWMLLPDPPGKRTERE